MWIADAGPRAAVAQPLLTLAELVERRDRPQTPSCEFAKAVVQFLVQLVVCWADRDYFGRPLVGLYIVNRTSLRRRSCSSWPSSWSTRPPAVNLVARWSGCI